MLNYFAGFQFSREETIYLTIITLLYFTLLAAPFIFGITYAIHLRKHPPAKKKFYTNTKLIILITLLYPLILFFFNNADNAVGLLSYRTKIYVSSRSSDSIESFLVRRGYGEDGSFAEISQSFNNSEGTNVRYRIRQNIKTKQDDGLSDSERCETANHCRRISLPDFEEVYIVYDNNRGLFPALIINNDRNTIVINSSSVYLEVSHEIHIAKNLRALSLQQKVYMYFFKSHS